MCALHFACCTSSPSCVCIHTLDPKPSWVVFFGWLNPVRSYSLNKILYPKRRIESYSIMGTIVSPNKILHEQPLYKFYSDPPLPALGSTVGSGQELNDGDTLLNSVDVS